MAKYQLRESALELLTRIGEEGGYSHVLLDQEISKRQLSSKDGALLTEIVYGTLQNKLKIDYQIHSYLAKQKKLKPWVKWLLYMSVYQMLYLERVPDHAVIHEAVEISKIKGHKGISNLVNGVLRNIQRNGVRSTEQISDPIEQLSIETSHPKWLVERWVDQYGIEITKGICYQNLKHLPMSVRVQPIRITRDTAIEELKSRGIQTEISRFSSQGLLITEGNILNDPLFKEGFISVQDQSSMLVAEMMDLSPELAVLDACSAPGGKQLILQKKFMTRVRWWLMTFTRKKQTLSMKKPFFFN
ncbi:transcription antitermination factor NusB [Halobacillus andaensis]|uniref:transcription antitermination factor NusB n=1 Tax=Halobacillus andaensis TaxID=1176239 RepID=UPI003D71234F